MTNRRIRVLVVDDSQICRDTAQLMLGEAGMEVLILDTPFRFGMKLLSLRPDIALVDVGMPALGGNQLVDLAHRRGLSEICPIVLFSDRPARELEQVMNQCGADGFISKSDDWPTITRTISALVRRRR